jgi:hypothetical protein
VNPCLFSRATNNFLLAGDRRGSLLRYGTHADKLFEVNTSKPNMKSSQAFHLLSLAKTFIILRAQNPWMWMNNEQRIMTTHAVRTAFVVKRLTKVTNNGIGILNRMNDNVF